MLSGSPVLGAAIGEPVFWLPALSSIFQLTVTTLHNSPVVTREGRAPQKIFHHLKQSVTMHNINTLESKTTKGFIKIRLIIIERAKKILTECLKLANN